MTSSPERPGFQVLAERPGVEVAVGAIGRFWRPNIPFVHVADARAFAAYAAPGTGKVAWALRVAPRPTGSHVEIEVRVDATDDAAWRRFRCYFHLIGPASRYMRRLLLRALGREFGRLPAADEHRPLPGDELLPDAGTQMTQAIDVAASPVAIWPWLAQMGCRRAGFYSIDLLDNGGQRSAREIRPELQHLALHDVIPATPRAADGFEVLRVEPGHVLALGGLYDRTGRQRPFASERPERFRQVTWTFVLEPLDGRTTRLHARVRAACSAPERWRVALLRPVHHVMQTAQLRNLARRVEGRLGRDWGNVAERVLGRWRTGRTAGTAPPPRAT